MKSELKKDLDLLTLATEMGLPIEEKDFQNKENTLHFFLSKQAEKDNKDKEFDQLT